MVRENKNGKTKLKVNFPDNNCKKNYPDWISKFFILSKFSIKIINHEKKNKNLIIYQSKSTSSNDKSVFKNLNNPARVQGKRSQAKKKTTTTNTQQIQQPNLTTLNFKSREDWECSRGATA
jgi:hypothetical protein